MQPINGTSRESKVQYSSIHQRTFTIKIIVGRHSAQQQRLKKKIWMKQSYNIYIYIGEGRLLITAREEFLVTTSSKIQPRGGCNISLIYRLPKTVSFVCYAQPL